MRLPSKELFDHHEPCPACRGRGDDSRGDNLGVWRDGHKHCFKCSYHEDGGDSLSIGNVRERLHKNKKGSDGPHIVLPSDFTSDLPLIALTWLRQYGITDEEIDKHHIGWTNASGSIVFPVFDYNGSLLMFQNRRFNGGGQRYFTSGLPETVFHILGSHSLHIACVEDMVSAIKVSRVAQVIPLWGSQLSIHRIKTLSDRFTNLVIWLDKDKAGYAIKRSQLAKPFFDDVKVIVTELDPKAYSTLEIKQCLI